MTWSTTPSSQGSCAANCDVRDLLAQPTWAIRRPRAQRTHADGFADTFHVEPVPCPWQAEAGNGQGTVEEKRAWQSIPLFARPPGQLTHVQRMEILQNAYNKMDKTRGAEHGATAAADGQVAVDLVLTRPTGC